MYLYANILVLKVRSHLHNCVCAVMLLYPVTVFTVETGLDFLDSKILGMKTLTLFLISKSQMDRCILFASNGEYNIKYKIEHVKTTSEAYLTKPSYCLHYSCMRNRQHSGLEHHFPQV